MWWERMDEHHLLCAGSTFRTDDLLWFTVIPASAVCSISKIAIMTRTQILQQLDLCN